MAAIHIDRVDRIEIKNGVVSVCVVSDEERLKWHMPLLTFRKAVALAIRTISEHDGSGEVVHLPRRGKG